MRILRFASRPHHPHRIALVGALVVGASIGGCRDVTRFSNDGDHYEGAIVPGSFVRSGISESTRLCVTLDAAHLQDAPGTISSSDGRFHEAKLRPIPQIWHDPLSTLTFGEGRTRNVLYVATPDNDSGEGDVFVVLSLMQSDGIEVRLLRGAPASPTGPGASIEPLSGMTSLFAVFTLGREKGPCSY